MNCHINYPLGTLIHIQLSIQTSKSSKKDIVLDTKCSETCGSFHTRKTTTMVFPANFSGLKISHNAVYLSIILRDVGGLTLLEKEEKTVNTNYMVFGLIRPGMNERYYTFDSGTLTITSTEVSIHEV